MSKQDLLQYFLLRVVFLETDGNVLASFTHTLVFSSFLSPSLHRTPLITSILNHTHTHTQNGKQLAAFTSFHHYFLALSTSTHLPPFKHLKASTLFPFFHSPLRPAISPHLRFQFVHSQAHFCDDSTRKPNKLYHLYYLLVSVYANVYYTQVSASFHIKYDSHTNVHVVKLKNERDHTRIHTIKQPSQARPSQAKASQVNE